MTPDEVDSAGGIEVTVQGKNLHKAEISIDGERAATTARSRAEIVFVAPAHDAGQVSLTAENRRGKAAYDGFTFVETPDQKYIIEYRAPEGPDGTRAEIVAFRQMKQRVLGQHGLTARRIGSVPTLPYEIVDNLTEEEIRDLRKDPNVKEVHKNVFRARQLEQSLVVIEQQQAYDWGATGEGYSVAVLDTGADYRQPELGSCSAPGEDCRVVYAQDTTPADDGQLDADPDRHGTNVSAIVARVAPEASIIALDVFEPAGAADSAVIKALDWVISHRDEYEIVAVNLSLGSDKGHSVSCPNTVYDSAFEWLLNDGIQVVVAAGNDGFKNGLSAPACHPLAIAVGATTDSFTDATRYPACADPSLPTDKVPCFSNSAETLAVLAPGTNISAGGQLLSGTSQAAPHVAGALAALKSKFPNRTNAELLLRLQQTGKRVKDEASGITRWRINLASAMNDRPEAHDDAAVALRGGGVVIDVLANDVDDGGTSQLEIEGVSLLGASDGVHARVIHNQIYVYLDADVTQDVTLRYSVKDEYGSLDTAQVAVDVLPHALPESRAVQSDWALVSKLGKRTLGPFIVYEAGRGDQRQVWLQALEPDGRLKGDPWSISGEEPLIEPNYLDLSYDDDGYTVAWVNRRSLDGQYRIRAANGKGALLPEPYTASYNYQGGAVRRPFVGIAGAATVVGWEDAWLPFKLRGQAWGRTPSSPSPIGQSHAVEGLIVSETSDYATMPLADSYIHLRGYTAGSSPNTIEARKLDLKGEYVWQDRTRKVPDWRENPPPSTSSLMGPVRRFAVAPATDGFGLAWTHAAYEGKCGVSFQRFDYEMAALGEVLPVLPELRSSCDVAVLRFDDGSHRVFWNENHGSVAVLLSASIGIDGALGEVAIDYWTEDTAGLAPYMIEALALAGGNYLLTWSNNRRILMSTTRMHR